MKKTESLFLSCKKIWSILSGKQKRGLATVVIMVFISAAFEVLCLPVVTPIINMATNMDGIYDNKLVVMFGELLKFDNNIDYVIFSIVLIIFVYLLKNLSILLLYIVQYNYIYKGQKELSARILRQYIYKNYDFHKNKNVAELQRDVSSDIANFYGALLIMVQLFTEIVIVTALGIYLLIQDFEVALITVTLLGILLYIVMFLYKKRLNKIGELTRFYAGTRNKWILQTLGAIKEIKVFGKEEYFYDMYSKENNEYHNCLKKQQLLVNVPKPIMETCAIASIMIALIVRLLIGNNVSAVMETLAVFAVAAFRLIPSFGRISNGVTTMSYYSASINAVYCNLASDDNIPEKQSGQKGSINISDKIEFRNVSFKYPDDERYILKNINFNIPKNKSIALIGPSGAGKTTLADLLLGINCPTDGNICVGDVDIFDNLESWHSNIGYIPQTIYLLDDTIKVNIAFGVEEDKIDEKKLELALKQAQLDEFVDSLEQGINTYVGEGGVKLSGGQRQRIGIARALYNNPEVLVLDEATSSLDNETEKAVMDAIERLQGTKTLIIIAHRLSTVKNCDFIYEVKNQSVSLVDEDARRKLFNA